MIISRTPLRMSFAGGGTDLAACYRVQGGGVLSAALDKYVYIMVNSRFSTRLRVAYSEVEEVEHVDQLKHNLVREALRLLKLESGLDISYMSDMLPAHEGSGLGSSSALLVGTLNALHAHLGRYASPRQLAEEACHIEIDVLGHPIGKQDQYAAAFGGLNHIRFNTDDSVGVSPLLIAKDVSEKLQQNLIAFYTGNTVRSDVILSEQREQSPANLDVLARLTELADELVPVLNQGDLRRFAAIMHEGWGCKKRLAAAISSDHIDALYDRARAAGALGGKILGSGGGGFLLLYCEPQHQPAVRQALQGVREASFGFEPLGSRIVFAS